jgi:hypothetical protein
LLDGVFERRCRDVVALVGDDQPVGRGEGGDVIAARQRLESDDIDGAAQLCPAAAELPGLDAEELHDPRAPLVGQGLAVDQHQRGDLAGGDDRAGHHRLPRPRRRRAVAEAAGHQGACLGMAAGSWS